MTAPASRRPSAPSAAAAARRTLRLRSGRIPALTWRIIWINLFGLVALGVGMLSLNRVSETVIAAQTELLTRQAGAMATLIVEFAQPTAADLAEYAETDPSLEGADPSLEDVETYAIADANDDILYNMDKANDILRTIAVPSGVRLQLYDEGGRLTGDTRTLVAQETVQEQPLPPLGGLDWMLEQLDAAYVWSARLLDDPLPRYIETPPDETLATAQEYWVWDALEGAEPTVIYSRNSADQLIMTAVAPVRRVEEVVGVLLISTEGDAVDRVIAQGREEILRLFLFGLPVFVVLSVLLAASIASPVQRLARAADVRDTGRADLSLSRVSIPDLTYRRDEIGDLSESLRRMTGALYARIDAIESFAADVAHEIKNPLTSLRSAVETMRLAKTDEQRERLLAVIEHDVARMNRLVTDISNASRLDAELVREQEHAFDLCALVQTVVDVSSRIGEKRDVRVVVNPCGPLLVHGMESRLGQVLHNFIDNAVSFSPAGGVVAVRVDSDGTWATASVMDQGPGVPPENLDSVFERFYTTARPEDDAFGEHSGLGLSISRQIIEAHGGDIWAENVPDGQGGVAGAKFNFRIPV